MRNQRAKQRIKERHVGQKAFDLKVHAENFKFQHLRDLPQDRNEGDELGEIIDERFYEIDAFFARAAGCPRRYAGRGCLASQFPGLRKL